MQEEEPRLLGQVLVGFRLLVPGWEEGRLRLPILILTRPLRRQLLPITEALATREGT